MSNQHGPILLGEAEVCAMVGLSRMTIRRMQPTGEFPRPLHVGRRVLFKRADIDAWVERRSQRDLAVAESDQLKHRQFLAALAGKVVGNV